MIYLRRLLAMQKIKIEDIGDLLSLNGDRQSFRHDVLTITREHWPPSSNLNNKIPPRRRPLFEACSVYAIR